MNRYHCPIIGKNYCKHENADGAMCAHCTVPEVYKGIRPNVPESHCEAGSRNIGYETPAPSVSTALDKIYYDMINNCSEFKNLSMDRQGEMMNDLVKVLDKYGLV